jgi:GT2 family glycosyltransferase/SAM-dependent methyltransferase
LIQEKNGIEEVFMKTFPEDFQCRHGIFYPHQEDYISFSDGALVEKYLEKVFSLAKNLASDSLETMKYIRDWPSKYHLSPLRANLLRPLPLAGHSRVLELGSGCGALTRYLGETVQSVVAVEGSKSRAYLTRLRCRDLTNVTVVAANFTDLRFEQPFDLVTLVGVLEYAGVYGPDNGDPFLSLLRLAFEQLHDHGALVLAIENKLGIKYFAGFNEDHLGKPFVGLEGYLDDKTPATFGRAELLDLLSRAGFQDYQILLPFPDYKLPNILINAAYTSAVEVRAFNLMDWCLQPYTDYSAPRHYLFNEHLVLANVAANGLLADLANSFLVVAYKNPLNETSIIPPIDWICQKINIMRHPKYQTETTLAYQPGQVFIKKQKIHKNMDRLGHPIQHILRDHDIYIQNSSSLTFLMLQSLGRACLSKKKFSALLQQWYNYLLQYQADENKLPPHYLDCIPDNLLVDEHNALHFIDAEWHWFEPIPAVWVLVRGLLTFWVKYRPWLERSAWPGKVKLLPFLKDCLARLNLTCSSREIIHCLRQEARFQHLVVWGEAGSEEAARRFLEHWLEGQHDLLELNDGPEGISYGSPDLLGSDRLAEGDLLKKASEEPAQAAASPPEAISKSRPSQARPPAASIIIPVYNNLELTQDCLESIWQHTPEHLYELIVVDNGSQDATPVFLERLAAAGRIRLIANATNLGYAKASNQGARAARGDFLVMLNNDTRVTPGWLEALLESVAADEQVAAVGAKLLYPDASVQHAGVAFNQAGQVYHLYRHFHPDHPAVNKTREFQVVTAACLLIRTSVFFRAGLFDENFQNCFEDVDLCLKVRQLGYRILYNPKSVVYHLESKTPGRFDRILENSRYFAAKWRDRIVPDDFTYYQEDGLRLEWTVNAEGQREAVIHDENENPFKQAARSHLDRGEIDRALALYDLALRFNPFDPRNQSLMAEKEALKSLAEPRTQAAQA